MAKVDIVMPLRDNWPFLVQLQKELSDAIESEKYGDLPVAAIIGLLEYLKFNLISRIE